MGQNPLFITEKAHFVEFPGGAKLNSGGANAGLPHHILRPCILAYFYSSGPLIFLSVNICNTYFHLLTSLLFQSFHREIDEHNELDDSTARQLLMIR